MNLFCNIKMKLTAFLILFCVFVFSGCAGSLSVPDHTSVRVTLIKSEYYEMTEGTSASIDVHSGETARFSVTVKNGFYVADTDYEGSEIEYMESGVTKILLPAVKYNVRVRLIFEEKIVDPPIVYPPDDESGADPKDDPYNDVENLNAIRYYANGGRYYDSETSYEAEVVLNGHLRPNTDIGTDKVYRNGYTLLGWNTKPDGSGVSYGLGSRCDLPEDRQLRLYAQWAQWSLASDFTLWEAEGSYCITAYNGNNENVCIPEKIDGMPVTSIAAGAFTGRQFKSVILPKSMERVEDEAFRGSTIEEFWFYDNLTYISDAVFKDSAHMPTVHINAILAPRYTKLDIHSHYADKVDLLISHEKKKKIILFGGSGALYSVDSAMIYEAFGREYQVVNMAINAWFPATAQTDIILNYIHEGDVFLHLPEMGSGMQLFYYNVFSPPGEREPDSYDDRYMMCFESNYDLFSLIDLDDAPGALDSFTRYNAGRQSKKEVSYSETPGFIDEYGDYDLDKTSPNREDIPISYEAEIRSDYLSDAALARLDLLYERIKEKGARVYLGYAAVNVSSLEFSDRDNGTHYLDKEAYLFDSLLREKIKNAPVIEEIEQAYYPGTQCFNTDWHLSDEGTTLNTEVLIACLKKYMI